MKHKNSWNIIPGIILLLFAFSCDNSDDKNYREIAYYFNNSLEGWKSFFSDYPVGEEEFYELEFKLEKLPPPLDTNMYALKLSGNNHSDDLLTCIYNEITGLAPNITYNVTFDLMLATNVATGGVGAGGSPDLALGVGAVDSIPSNTVDHLGYYRPSFEVKLQSGLSNEVMQVIGNLGATDTTTVYTPVMRNNYGKPMKITTNSSGTMYLLMGWDSGFEGITTIYIKQAVIRIEEL